jgi:hypothetical protein
MQNTSPVFSVPASATDLVPFRRAKVTATGAAYAGADEAAVGTLLPGDPGDDLYSAIQDLTFGVHFAVMGSDTNIAVGDEIEAAADGKIVKLAAGPAIGVALEAGTDEDDMIRVKYYPSPGSFKVVAAGIHTWAGGAATTDSIAVTGLLATDIVLATLVLRNSTQTLVLAANDAANDQIDLTLSANGQDDTCKVAYAVLRA